MTRGASMRPVEPRDIVDRYLEAFARRDFPVARSYLADSGFEYISPIARFDDADVFLSNMEGVGAILHRIETRLCFVNGNDVCHVLDVTVSLSGYEKQSAVSLARVEHGRIVRIETLFDATNFHRMIGDT